MTDTADTPQAAGDARQRSVTLDAPIQRGEQTIGSISLRRPTVRELRGLSMNALLQTDVNEHAKLLPRISTPTLLAHEIDAMDPADFTALAGEVVGFLLPKAALDSLPE